MVNVDIIHSPSWTRQTISTAWFILYPRPRKSVADVVSHLGELASCGGQEKVFRLRERILSIKYSGSETVARAIY
jgi:hypothetical protein